MRWLAFFLASTAWGQVQDLKTIDYRTIPSWNPLLPNNSVFLSEGHSNEPVRVYFNDLGKNAYGGLCELPFPPGVILAKSFVGDEKEEKLQSKMVYLMQKRQPGYDPENGDWEYGAAQRQEDGSYKLTHQGRIQACIPCHKAYPQWDYALSVERHRKYNGFWGPMKLWLGL